jgi:hypothetical protein
MYFVAFQLSCRNPIGSACCVNEWQFLILQLIFQFNFQFWENQKTVLKKLLDIYQFTDKLPQPNLNTGGRTIFHLLLINGGMTRTHNNKTCKCHGWSCFIFIPNVSYVHVSPGRGYFAGLRVTKCNKATVLLTLTLFQTETLTLTVILTP